MPTGPKGEKRPADAIARAVKVMRIRRALDHLGERVLSAARHACAAERWLSG
jgi:hypothetical protein